MAKALCKTARFNLDSDVRAASLAVSVYTAPTHGGKLRCEWEVILGWVGGRLGERNGLLIEVRVEGNYSLKKQGCRTHTHTHTHTHTQKSFWECMCLVQAIRCLR